MEWGAGYVCEWRVFEVNTDTWADAAQVGGFSGLKVSTDSSRDTIESGSMTLTKQSGEPFRQRYLRVALTAKAADSIQRVDVSTMLWGSTSGTLDRGSDQMALIGNSVLWPASRETVPDGFYAPKGVNGAEFVADMLSPIVAAPIVVEGGFTLDQHLVFDLDSKYLACARRLLDAGGYSMRISGKGVITIGPKPSEPSLLLSRASARLLTPGIKYNVDPSSIPNRLRVVDGLQEVIVVNDDPSSETSYQSKGYWDDVVERSPVRVNGETLYAYGRRSLSEKSRLRYTYTYGRRYWPGVTTECIVRGTLADVGINGDLRVSRQTLTCGKAGIDVQEEAYREVSLWQA